MENLSKDIRFRYLLDDEFEIVRPLFNAQDWALPNPETSVSILVGEQDGKIVMFNTVQPIIHIGPAWIDPELRHQGHWKGPMGELKAALSNYHGVMLVAMSPATERIAEFLGMEKSKGTLYLKDFEGV